MEVLTLYFTCLFNILKNNVNFDCAPRTVHEDACAKHYIKSPNVTRGGVWEAKGALPKNYRAHLQRGHSETYLNFILRGIERIFDHFGKQVAQSDMTEEDGFFLLFLFGFSCLQGVEIVEGV